MLQSALQSRAPEGVADQHVVFEVFARQLPQGRRYGVFAGVGRLLDAFEDFTLRTGGNRAPAQHPRGRRGDLLLARGAARRPAAGRHHRAGRGRGVRADDPGPGGRRHVRGGRPAGDADPVDPESRQRDRCRRSPHDVGGRHPAVPGDGLAPHSRAGGRRRGPGRLHRRASARRPTSRPPAATRSRRRAPAPTPSRWRTRTSRRHSRHRSRRWGSAPRCWWTPMTLWKASGQRSPWPDRSSAPSGSTAATWARSPSRCGRCSTASAPPRPGSS